MKEVVIKLTDKCPCKCTFCESGNGKFANHLEISDDNIMSFAEQLVRENLKICVISGGEPLLHKDFLGFLRRCRELDLSVNVILL